MIDPALHDIFVDHKKFSGGSAQVVDQLLDVLGAAGPAGMKPGSLVILNSGGPLMTVWAQRIDGVVSCLWFDGNELREGAFSPAELILAAVKEDPPA